MGKVKKHLFKNARVVAQRGVGHSVKSRIAEILTFFTGGAVDAYFLHAVFYRVGAQTKDLCKLFVFACNIRLFVVRVVADGDFFGICIYFATAG